jgi:hypothetical protein
MTKRFLLLINALGILALAQASAVTIPSKYDIGGFALGVQAWTFNDLTAFTSIG